MLIKHSELTRTVYDVHSRLRTMDEFLTRHWEMLIGRTTGPLTLRLIFQPTMATILAIRAGLKDAREGQSLYFWAFFLHPTQRPLLWRQGWKDVGKVFTIAVVLDIIYEIIVYRWVYPLQAVIVGIVLAIVPYLIFRGLTNRIARRIKK